MAAIIVAAIAAACGAGTGSDASSPRSAPAHAEELDGCVRLTNDYRATLGLAALRRSPRLEAYAARAARNDGIAHHPHEYFERTEGGGVALAENLVPWWSLARRHTVRAVVEDGLALMWNEGPAGAHRRNMAGPYTELGCGILVRGDEVTVVQAFR